MNDEKIIPHNWELLSGWRTHSANVKNCIKQMEEFYAPRGYEGFYRLWQPAGEAGAFVSHGIRRAGNQPNGNAHSVLFAFGWWARPEKVFTDEYVRDRCGRAVEAYARFADTPFPEMPKGNIDENARFDFVAVPPPVRQIVSDPFIQSQLYRAKITQQQLIEAALDGDNATLQLALEDILS